MGFFDKILRPDTNVEVTFLDQATGEVIGITKLPGEQLPAAFDVPTSFTLGTQEWQVATAVPMTSTEFSRTKKLTLRLHKIEYINGRALHAAHHFRQTTGYGWGGLVFRI